MFCPHCGFDNQDTSGPCARCKRPLHSIDVKSRSPTLAFVASDAAPDEAIRLLRQAIDLEARGDFRAAFISCQTILIDHFDHLTPKWKFAIYKIMGRVSVLQRKPERAKKYLVKANALFAGDEEVALILDDLERASAGDPATLPDLSSDVPDLSDTVSNSPRPPFQDRRETLVVKQPVVPAVPRLTDDTTQKVNLFASPPQGPPPFPEPDLARVSTLDVVYPAGGPEPADPSPPADEPDFRKASTLDVFPAMQEPEFVADEETSDNEPLLGKVSTLDVAMPVGIAHEDAQAAGLWSVGFWKRSLALGFDGLLIGAVFVLATTGYSLSKGGGMFEVLENAFGDIFSIFLLGASYAGLLLLYLTAFTWLGGQSVGKMALGIRVVGLDGKRLSFGRSLMRALGMLLAALPGLAGFLWTAFDLNRRGWHDRLGHSLVIRARPVKPAS